MKEPTERRRPRVFNLDDPSIETPPDAPVGPEPVDERTPQPPLNADDVTDAPDRAADDATRERPTAAELKRGIGWGSILMSALGGLFMLGLGAWFARLVSAALARDDIVGWTAYGLLIVAAVAASVIAVRELIGLSRLSRLANLKRDIVAAIAAADAKAELSAVKRVRALYDGRADMRWRVSRFVEHEKDVHDAGALVALAERELVAPLDTEARRTILKSAKRVSVVTALSPVFFIAVLYVLAENLRMLRGLATLYGGRPGVLGALRLGRMVVTHIVATGGIAMTDDLFGQFLGQDLVRRLSRRLGEGVFNGALTARIGAAAIDVCRPLPFIEAKPIRVRDMVSELLRRQAADDANSRRAGERIR